jgi:hypothetical protein
MYEVPESAKEREEWLESIARDDQREKRRAQRCANEALPVDEVVTLFAHANLKRPSWRGPETPGSCDLV